MADRSDIDHGFAVFEHDFVPKLTRHKELMRFRKHTWNVCMALKAVVIDEREEPFDFTMIIDIVRKYVFRERISGRSMNEQEFSVLMESG